MAVVTARSVGLLVACTVASGRTWEGEVSQSSSRGVCHKTLGRVRTLVQVLGDRVGGTVNDVGVVALPAAQGVHASTTIQHIGGRIAGEQADLKPNTLHQNRDMPVLNDYRNVLAGVFRQLYGLNPSALETIFPDAKPQNLRLV